MSNVCPLVPESMEELRQGGADAAVGIFPEAPPEVRMRRLFIDGFATVARTDHPRVQGALSLEQFLREDHILVAPRGSPTGTVDAALAERGMRRRVARTFPNFLSALWHVVESDDLLTVSRRLVRAASVRLPVQLLQPPLALADYTLMLAWHPRVDRAAEDIWFRGILSQAAAQLDLQGN